LKTLVITAEEANRITDSYNNDISDTRMSTINEFLHTNVSLKIRKNASHGRNETKVTILTFFAFSNNEINYMVKYLRSMGYSAKYEIIKEKDIQTGDSYKRPVISIKWGNNNE
jgi:hypothetical protein